MPPLAASEVGLFEHPELVTEARRELEERRVSDFVSRSLEGDRGPPLGYRR